eukprot:tig00000241_g21056.t1
MRAFLRRLRGTKVRVGLVSVIFPGASTSPSPYAFIVVEYRINASASSAAGSEVVDRFTSYVDRATGELATFDVALDQPYDVRERPFYKSAVASGAPIWTPVFPFALGRSGFVHVTPIYSRGGGPSPPGIGAVVLPPDPPRPAGTNGSEGLKGVLTIGFQSFGVSEYLDSVRVAENGFTAIVADDIEGPRRAIGWRNPEILMRPVPLVPEQGTSYEFVPTAELADPELRALMLALPADVHELPGNATLDPAAYDEFDEKNALSFKVGKEDFVGRWAKVLGTFNDTLALSLLVAVAAPEHDITGNVQQLTVANAIVSSVSCALAILLSAFVIFEVWRAMRRFRDELDRISFFDLSDSHNAAHKPRAPAPVSACRRRRSPARRRSRPGPPAGGGAPASPGRGAGSAPGGPQLSRRGPGLSPSSWPPPDGASSFPATYPVAPESASDPTVLLATSADLPPSVRRPSHAAPLIDIPPAPLPPVLILARDPALTSGWRPASQVGEAFAKMKHAIRARPIMGGISDALLVVRPDGSVAHMNESARAMFRTGPSEINPAPGAGEREGPGAGAPASVLDYFAPEYTTAMSSFLAASGRGGPPVLEVEALRAPPAPADAAQRFPVEISVGRMQYDGEASSLLVLVVRDISQRKTMERALVESERRARVASEDMKPGAPIFIVDLELRVAGWNWATARLTGIPEGERSFPLACASSLLVAPEDRAAAEALFSRALRGGEEAAGAAPAELCLRVPPTSDDLRLLLSATPRRDARGAVIGAVAIGQAPGAPAASPACPSLPRPHFLCQDITEKRRRIEAEAINETKNRFLAYTIHELRTPLNGVLGLGELLGETALDEEQRELSHAIHTCSEQMLVIVNDLLDLHKIEAGKIELEAVPFDLRPVLEELIEVVAPTAFSKGIEMASFIPPPSEGERCPRLVGDPCRLKQFTRKGHVILACEVLPAGPATALVRVHTRLHIDVKDTGLGIEPAGIDRIFQDYAQADQSVTRLYGGTGMGLPIVKRLAELMGGTVSVESAPGVGSTFTVEARPPARPAPHASPTRPARRCRSRWSASAAGRPAAPAWTGPRTRRWRRGRRRRGWRTRRRSPRCLRGGTCTSSHRSTRPPRSPRRPRRVPSALGRPPGPEVAVIVLEYARAAGWPRPASGTRRPDDPPPALAVPRPPRALLVLDESVPCRPVAAAAASAAASLVYMEPPIPCSARAHRRRSTSRRPSVRYHKFVKTLQRALEALAAADAVAPAPAEAKVGPEAEAKVGAEAEAPPPADGAGGGLGTVQEGAPRAKAEAAVIEVRPDARPPAAAPAGRAGAGVSDLRAPPGAPEAAERPAEQPGILVVDDVDLNRKVCASLLKKGGLACDEAVHGAEALDRVRARAARGEAPYRVVFMDMEARGGGGDGGPPSAIVALTANVVAESLQRCLDAGMDALLAKRAAPPRPAARADPPRPAGRGPAATLSTAYMIITVVSNCYAERSAERLSSYFLDQTGYRLQEHVGSLFNRTERSAARASNAVRASVGDEETVSSANFEEILATYISELLVPGFAFDYYSLALPNHEALLARPAPRPRSLLSAAYTALPISVTESRINATASAATGSQWTRRGGQVVDRILSYVDRATGALAAFEVVRNISYDVRVLPYYTTAAARGAPIWTPVFPFVMGHVGFLYAMPIFSHGGGASPSGTPSAVLPPDRSRPAGTNGSEGLKAVARPGTAPRSKSASLDGGGGRRAGWRSFTAIVADDDTGARRAIGWRNPEILVRPVPLVPGQRPSREFVPTAELADPELRALLSALPGDVHELPGNASLDPAAFVDFDEENALSFKVGKEDFVGRWVKVLGTFNDTLTLSLLVAVAAPERDITGNVRRLTVANAIVSSVSCGLALLLGAFVVFEVSASGSRLCPRRAWPPAGRGPLTAARRQVRRAMRRFRDELDRISFFDLSDSHNAAHKPRAPAPVSACRRRRSPARRRSRPGPPAGGGAPASPGRGAGAAPAGPQLSRRGSGLVPGSWPPSDAARGPSSHTYPVAPEPAGADAPTVLLATSADLPPSVRRPSLPALPIAISPAPAPSAPPPEAEVESSARPASLIRELDQVGEAFAKMKHAIRARPDRLAPLRRRGRRPLELTPAPAQIMGGISDALLVVRPDGSVAHMNESARAMFRTGPSEINPAPGAGEREGPGAGAPASVLDYFAPEYTTAMSSFLAASGRGGPPVLEVEALRAPPAPADAAQRFPVEISVGRMQYDGEASSLLVLVVRDISQRKARGPSPAPFVAAWSDAACAPGAPIFIVDLELRVAGWNWAAARLTGIPEGERSSPRACDHPSADAGRTAGRMLGRGLLELVAPEDRAAAEALFSRALRGGEEAARAPPAELCLRVPPTSDDLRLLLSATPRRDARGAVIGADITEKRRRIEAEAINETKSRFLAYTIHELRTPLNGVLGLGELLGETALDEEQRELSHAIHTCSEQMLVIVNDLLDLHKIEAGKIELEAIPFDLRPVLEELIEVVAPTAFSKGIEMASFIPPPSAGERCPRLVGDPCRLKQFTRKGHVIVACEVLPAGPAAAVVRVHTRLHIDVKDTGLGIDPAGIDRIFQDYAQADQSVTRLYGGTGMGLPIVKRMAELMGGTVSVESAPGVGSTFTVEVPLPLVDECGGPPSQPGGPGGNEAEAEDEEVAPGPAAARLEDAPSLATLPPRRHTNEQPPLYPPRLALPAGLAEYPPLWVVHPDSEVAAIVLEYARSAGWPRPASGARRPDEPPPDPAAPRPPRALLVLDESVPCRPVAAAAASAAASLVCLEPPIPRSARAHRRRSTSRRPSVRACASEAPPECTLAPPRGEAGPALVSELPLVKPVRYHKFVKTLQRALEALAAAESVAPAADADAEAEAEAKAGPEAEAKVGAEAEAPPAAAGAEDGLGTVQEGAPGAEAEAAVIEGSARRSRRPARAARGGARAGAAPPAPPDRKAPARRGARGGGLRPAGPAGAPEAAERPAEQPGILVVDDVDLKCPAPPRPAPPLGSSASRPPAGPHLAGSRKVCASLLKKGGLACDEAAHGAEALDRVRARAARGDAPYRVVFMDMEMPVLDGTGATREIRRLEAAGETGGPPSAIVALTANVVAESLQRCLDAGMDALLAKRAAPPRPAARSDLTRPALQAGAPRPP